MSRLKFNFWLEKIVRVLFTSKDEFWWKSAVDWGEIGKSKQIKKGGKFQNQNKVFGLWKLGKVLSDVKLWFGLVSFLARVFSLEFDLLLVYFTQLEIVFASSEELLRRLTSRIKFRFLLLDVSRQRLIIRSKLSAIFGNVKKCQKFVSKLDLIFWKVWLVKDHKDTLFNLYFWYKKFT